MLAKLHRTRLRVLMHSRCDSVTQLVITLTAVHLIKQMTQPAKATFLFVHDAERMVKLLDDLRRIVLRHVLLGLVMVIGYIVKVLRGDEFRSPFGGVIERVSNDM